VTTGPGDDALETALRDAADRFDPVPPALRWAAVAAFELRSLDAELAALAFDSAQELATVRGPSGLRLLTFAAGERTIELELSPGDAGRRVVGQIFPVGPDRLEVQRPDTDADPIEVPVDPLGRFTATLTPGPFRLRCRWPGEVPTALVTEWATA